MTPVRPLLFTTSCLFLGCLAACGGGRSEPTASPDGGLIDPDAPVDDRTFIELCARPEEYCERLYACATPERLEEDQFFFGHDDEASCVTAQQETTGLICQLMDASIAAGRSAVDLPALAACADYMTGLRCESYVHDDPSSHAACAGAPFMTPLVETGGACAVDAECSVAGDICTADGEALGECQPAPGDGEACLGDRCGTGLVCEEGICRAGTACENDPDCPETSFCDHPGNDFRTEIETPGQMGVCAPRLDLGAECEDVLACADGLYCDDTNGADDDGYRRPGHCAAPKAPGAECNEPADCASFDCTADSVCS